MKRYWYLFDLSIVLLLTVVFGFMYLTNHAWGSWGDDSPGYIYTAGQFLHGEELVSQDPLVQAAFSAFEDEPLARFVAPTHHEIISPDGWIASRYPIGLGFLLYLTAEVSGSDELMYVLVPILAVGVVLLTYVLALLMICTTPALQRVIGIMSAVTVGMANLYANYAVSQPMREIPSMFFFMLAFVGIILGLRKWKYRWIGISILLGAGLAYGYSINIRETSGILLLPIVIWFFYGIKKKEWKARAKLLGVFFIGLVLAASLSIWNSAAITEHKEKFRAKDISSIAITSNFDHVQSLSIQNLYNNQGKFRPGVGGVNQYWGVMQQFSDWPPLLLAALLGLLFLWKQDRKQAYLLGSWFAVIFILFSAWINPYARYILPLLPAIAISAAFGMVATLVYIRKKLELSRMTWSLIALVIVISFFVSQQPSLAKRQEHIQGQQQVFKALSRDDLHTVKAIAQSVEDNHIGDKQPLLLMVGSWKSGLSEMIMTHSNLRVIRFPRKPKERPPLDEMLPFLQDLQETHDLYLWYDGSANADEQRLRILLDLEILDTFDFSFQPAGELYRVKDE